MKKIAITGSLASGKTTASKILSLNRGPLFSADKIVKNLYQKKKFKKLISKKFQIKNYSKIKTLLREKILKRKTNITKLEKIIHPIVRKEMYKFKNKNKGKRMIFYEIPLLVESKLMNYFDIIFYIKAKKSTRLKRFKLKGGGNEFFNFLNKKQLSDIKKIKHCNYVIPNEKNKKILKKKLLDIIKKYE